MERTAGELAKYLGAELEGNAGAKISGCASVNSAAAGDLVFVDSPKQLDAAAKCAAQCVVLAPGAEMAGKTVLRAKNPRLAFARAIAWMVPKEFIAKGIHASAAIAKSAKLGEGVSVGPCAVIEDGAEIGAGSEIGAQCFVGAGAKLGAGCRIYPRVTIAGCVKLGERVVLHSGAVIGSDGFGFVPTENGFEKFPQIGSVEIADDVEIGANTTIDRGALDATRIGRGVKIDNLVQIGHNCEIGEHTVISAQAGLAGSSYIGRNVMLGGQVGIAGHGRIEDGAQLAPKSGVAAGKVIHAGTIMFGAPARPLDKAKEINAVMGRLPELVKRVRRLEEAAGVDARIDVKPV
jgi:UDP-3-O-[3-hydroxymyristoyl] glucosamine N-acyltransferase